MNTTYEKKSFQLTVNLTPEGNKKLKPKLVSNLQKQIYEYRIFKKEK